MLFSSLKDTDDSGYSKQAKPCFLVQRWHLLSLVPAPNQGELSWCYSHMLLVGKGANRTYLLVVGHSL